MNNQLNNIFCKCGHRKEDHYIRDNYTHCKAQCWHGAIDHGSYITDSCQCPGYKPDNLSYLEKKYEERLPM